jgi:8-oxo-dGTP pyrophosphatase MutT (NUDIX family)
MQKYTMDKLKHNAAIMWFKLPINMGHLLDKLVNGKFRFEVHHANKTHIMLVRHLSGMGKVDNAPPFGTHYIKVECMVVEEPLTGKMPRYLMVKEQYARADSRNTLKFVTGAILPGETIDGGAVREVREETGIEARFISMIGVASRIQTRFERDELIIGCLLHAKPMQEPKPDKREIKTALWVEVEEAMKKANGQTMRWIKTAGKAGREHTMHKLEAPDLRGEPHKTYFYVHP